MQHLSKLFKLKGMPHAQFGIHCLQYEVMHRKLIIYFLVEGLGVFSSTNRSWVCDLIGTE